MEHNYEEWMTKTVQTEKAEWFTDTMPEFDGPEEYYHTSAPVIIFEMINQYLQVTNTINPEFTFDALVLSIQQLTHYGMNYRQCIVEFKEKHFKDRSQVSIFLFQICMKCQHKIFFVIRADSLVHPTYHYYC